MAGKTAIRADAILLRKCQVIFGEGLVRAAYVTTYDYGTGPKKEVCRRLDQEAFLDDDREGLICYDAATIVLEFNNGVMVEFTNSEWASISRPGKLYKA